MDVVGRRFKEGDMFISEVLRSAKTMHTAMDILQPILAQSEVQRQGTLFGQCSVVGPPGESSRAYLETCLDIG
ncbi:MAG: B12-binding domain-containing protein [Desulfovermiculus sp.]